jgi:hypothetical protein
MNRIPAILFLVIFLSLKAYGQSDSSYYVNVSAGAGYGLFLTELDTDGLNKSGFNGSFRIMWHPEYRLGIGLETGYLQFYSLKQQSVNTEYGTTDINAKLNAVPILLIISMNIYEGFDLCIGSGPYLLYSTVESHNNKVTSTEINSGFLMSGRYLHPINNSISIGGELKYNYVNKINDGSLSLQFLLRYHILEY